MHFKSIRHGNVFIKDCLGYDIFFIGDSPHSIENAFVESRAARAVEISQHGDRPQAGTSSVVFNNVHIRRVDGTQEIRVSRNSKLQAERCTFLGLNVNVTPGGQMSARDCVFSGEPKPEIILFAGTTWSGDGNIYDLSGLRMDKTAFTSKTFADFQKLTGGDKTSRWTAAAEAKDAGADADSLRKLESSAAAVVQRWKETR